MFDDEFEELREIVHKENLEMESSLIKEWTTKIGVTTIPFAYSFSSYPEHIFTVYSSRPGILIGYRGENVRILKELLNKYFMHDYFVKFTEIRGNFYIPEGKSCK